MDVLSIRSVTGGMGYY